MIGAAPVSADASRFAPSRASARVARRVAGRHAVPPRTTLSTMRMPAILARLGLAAALLRAAVALGVLFALGAVPARAEPSPARAEPASARGLFLAGDAALEAGDGEDALELLLAAWRAGANDAAFVTAESSKVVERLVELGAKSAAARRALERLRAEAQARVLEGDGWLAATRLATIDRVRHDERATLASWERAAEALPPDDAGRRILFRVVEPLLIEQKRYEEVLRDAEDPLARLERAVDGYRRTASLLSAGTGDGQRLGPLRVRVVRDAASSYEALLGAGHRARADDLARAVLAFDDSVEAHALLAERAVRAGDTEALRRLNVR